jgi:hypothetical protein
MKRTYELLFNLTTQIGSMRGCFEKLIKDGVDQLVNIWTEHMGILLFQLEG